MDIGGKNILLNPGEIKDAAVIFDLVWKNLVAKYGEERLIFPKGLPLFTPLA